jgi:hypothetical protein
MTIVPRHERGVCPTETRLISKSRTPRGTAGVPKAKSDGQPVDSLAIWHLFKTDDLF